MSLLRPPAPTLEEVAAAAGVSRSTASRVINGSSQVSSAVVESVNAAIAELNYMPNRAARSLANRQTMAIALIVPEDTTRFFGDPYFAAIVQGITKELENSDYVLNLQLASSEKTRRYLGGGNVDGALVVSHHAGDQFLESLSESLPLVYGGRPLNDRAEGSYFVDVDNAAAAAKGTQYLIDQGRTRIATITGPLDMPAGIDRSDGWARALNAAGLDASRTANGDFSFAGGARAMRALLDGDAAAGFSSGSRAGSASGSGSGSASGSAERAGGIDGLFVASDLMAIGAVAVLREYGLRVPTDVAVVGFDDSPAATSGVVKLTTVHQPSTEMGAAMADMLLRLLRGDAIETRRIMETSIVVRESA